MAKLPPKIPNNVSQGHQHHHNHQWSDFRHENINVPPSDPPQPWINEFMEFSAAKRNAHRRSVSDSSLAFTEAGTTPFPGSFHGRETDIEKGKNYQFEKFDDEQFMSMFNNELGASYSNPSSTSDHNSTNEDKKRRSQSIGNGRDMVGDGDEVKPLAIKNEAEEVESLCTFEKEEQQEGEGVVGSKSGNIGADSGNNNGSGCSDQPQTIDPKRFKRILANRQSAQRSRVRKLQYISELERSVTALQSEVSVLSPRVAFLDHQRMILNVDNNSLKAKIAALAQDKVFKDAHQEALKREIERLREVYYHQSLNKPETTSSPIPSTSIQPQQPDTILNENEQFTC